MERRMVFNGLSQTSLMTLTLLMTLPFSNTSTVTCRTKHQLLNRQPNPQNCVSTRRRPKSLESMPRILSQLFHRFGNWRNLMNSPIQESGGADKDIKVRIRKSITAFNMLKKIWNASEISKFTEIRIFNSNVKSVSLLRRSIVKNNCSLRQQDPIIYKQTNIRSVLAKSHK